MQEDQTLTLAEALTHPQRGCMTYHDLDVSVIGLGSLAARWLRLLGYDQPGVALELLGAASDDLFGDGSLMIMLAAPADVFREWFTNDDYSIYDLTEKTGSEAWAAEALARMPAIDWPQPLLS